MTTLFDRVLPRLLLVALCAAGAAVAGCGSKNVIPEGIAEADKYLFDRGNEEVQAKNWMKARTYFQRLVDGYPQSTYRPDAKLGIADTYLGENTTESLVLAVNEYREFLSFYPTHARADYAQYKIAMSHFGKMRAPERDQTETREALKEFDLFFERHPASPLVPEVRKNYRLAKDRLTQASVNVGVFYFKARKWYPGAIQRFKEVLAEDPEFSGMDTVYYYLAESLLRSNKKAEAIPYLDRLLKEYPESPLVPEAKKTFDLAQAADPPK
ncbi:MAG: outer membrane protein assembly factor BamD [Vicinamibacterales bacterium]